MSDWFQDNEKRTPLHAAAYLGDAEIIELLILSGLILYTDFSFRQSYGTFCCSVSLIDGSNGSLINGQ